MDNEEMENMMDDNENMVTEMQKAILDGEKIAQEREIMEKARERCFRGQLSYAEFERIFGQKAIRIEAVTLWRAAHLARYAVMPVPENAKAHA